MILADFNYLPRIKLKGPTILDSLVNLVPRTRIGIGNMKPTEFAEVKMFMPGSEVYFRSEGIIFTKYWKSAGYSKNITWNIDAPNSQDNDTYFLYVLGVTNNLISENLLVYAAGYQRLDQSFFSARAVPIDKRLISYKVLERFIGVRDGSP